MIERILDLMEKNHVTAKQLTSDLEISKSSISDWKRGKGKPTSDAIVKIAEYFDVSTDYLLGRKQSAVSNDVDEEVEALVDMIYELDKEDRETVTKILDALINKHK